MLLKIQNYKNVKPITIEMNGITIICGKNNTGETLINKILYYTLQHRYNDKDIDSYSDEVKYILVNSEILRLNKELYPLYYNKFSDSKYTSSGTYSNKCLLDYLEIYKGIKPFDEINNLIKNGTISDKTMLIIESPENNLHPEYQVALAKLFVLINKIIGTYITLNTYSTYILNSIEIFSALEKLADKCKYYLSSHDGNCISFKDVTKNTNLIYEGFAAPLQYLEQLQCKKLEIL